MKSFLLIGLGRYGRHVARKLDELGHHVLAVDKQPERVQNVISYVANAQIGDSTDTEFLRGLGVRDFDACIVGIGDDFQSSLETVSLLKEMGAKLVVARASRGRHAKFLLRNGADEVVYPERQLANWTAVRYSADHILDYIELDADYGIFEMATPPEWYGRTVGELGIRQKYHLNVLAVRRRGKLDMDVHAATTFTAEDAVLVLGRPQDLRRCFRA